RLAWRLAELSDLVELADARLAVDDRKNDPSDRDDRQAEASPHGGGVRRVAQLDVVDVVVPVAGDVVHREEAPGAQRLGMVRIRGRIELADERLRARIAAPRLGAAGRVAPDDQRLAAFAKISGAAGVLSDAPAAGEADRVRMQQAAIAFAVRPPAQIGVRVGRARGRFAKCRWAHEWQE